jgi:hypothetical protein
MRTLVLALLSLLVSLAGQARAQTRSYPPLSAYLMPRDSEIALAKTAAPENISSRASIKVLTSTGYQLVHTGDNGFVCLVMRGWAAPTYTPAQFRGFVYDATIRGPICFSPAAVKNVLPYYELRTTLGIAGRTPAQIADAVQAAYASGRLPVRDGVSFAYMFSHEQMLGQGIGHWHPHMMVFAPYYTNAMLGGNPFGGMAPQVSDDGGTPFAVVVIPVDFGGAK